MSLFEFAYQISLLLLSGIRGTIFLYKIKDTTIYDKIYKEKLRKLIKEENEMRRLVTLSFVFVLIFSTVALGAKKNVGTAKAGNAIVGEVVSIEGGTVTVKDDKTDKENKIRAAKAQLKGLKEGYRVEVKESKGTAKSIKVLGITNPSQD